MDENTDRRQDSIKNISNIIAGEKGKYMSKMLEEIIQQPAVLAGISEANRETVQALVRELKERNIHHVTIAARGSSDHAGIFGQYLLTTTCDVVCGLAVPSAVTIYGAKPDYSDSLVIGISQSGQAADVLEVIRVAKACGAVTASITNAEDSLLAKEADYHLFCNAGKEESVAATKTFSAQLYLMALLAAEWSGKQELKEELNVLPALLKANIATLQKQIGDLIQRYRYISEGFVLGRGYCYPIALENALKIQETNYIRMKGAAISDFYHGPLAQVYEGAPVILLAMEGPVFEDVIAMADRLSQIGAELVVVTDNAELAERFSPLSFLVKKGASDVSGAFSAAAFAQLFACLLADVRGADPDAPRFLNKVTITK